MNWISVKDRLPDEGQSVQMVYINNDSESVVIMGNYVESQFWYNNTYRLKQVTHWMPPPEPPKEQQ